MNNPQVSTQTAARLLEESKALFVEVFKHGTLVVEYYKPDKVDHQKPHRVAVYFTTTVKDQILNLEISYLFRQGPNTGLSPLPTIFQPGCFFMDRWEGRSD